LRDAIVAGVQAGVTSEHGLIAHGRGEALDYLMGEATQDFARAAIDAAARRLVGARHPVISVNGNAAALVAAEMVILADLLGAPLEVKIFHTSEARERAIQEHMLRHGAREILMPTREAQLDFIESNRRFVHPDGIYKADVVFVPLEDGDRCQALCRMGKDVVTVDLNPMSRTSRAATISIVDNVMRAMPALVEAVRAVRQGDAPVPAVAYDNEAQLAAAELRIRTGA
jgi:4-phosphopantoate--beta-alanine ligase